MIRIVQMHFREDTIDEAKALIASAKSRIEQMPGCQVVRSWQDIHAENCLFTYSIWNSEDDLNHYRASALFGEIWPSLKRLFVQKAAVWSVKEWLGE